MTRKHYELAAMVAWMNAAMVSVLPMLFIEPISAGLLFARVGIFLFAVVITAAWLTAPKEVTKDAK